MNVALHGPDARVWSFTERGADAVARDRDQLAIGESVMRWVGDELVIDLKERTKPFFEKMPEAVIGRIRLRPEMLFDHQVILDARGRHVWWPIAPTARVEVALTSPALRFTGRAYHDANQGVEALEAGFRRWTWSRAALPDGTAV
ncbi:MAG: carotenoid 1,2-hydratase, partial [Myxococcales bacterium]|nr:carotenoid 1,2-hydratase [Myxococcales bacterium]